MLFTNLTLYLSAFILIWLGSGIVITALNKFSKKLRFSPFAVSFVVLGLLTSIPEFAVGLRSVTDHNPEIFIGNLIGGVAALFLFVIPVLAVFGNGINLKHELDSKSLLATLSVIFAPTILVLDQKVSNLEGIMLIILYFLLLLIVEQKHGIFDKENTELLKMKAYSYIDVVKIILGIGVVFISSSIIVDKTIFFANLFQISPFYISLIIISLGTNLPELSLAVRSVATGKKDIAMGDYMGSAAANTLLFGVFTVLNNGEVLTVENYFVTFLFIATALGLFYVYSQSKKFISRADGIILMITYFTFIVLEFIK